MASFSKSELAAKSLRQPGLYGPDEPISADDQADAEVSAESSVDMLAEMGIGIPNGSVDNVPSAWLIPLAKFIGNVMLVESYGGALPTAQQMEALLLPLRRMSAKQPTGSVLETEHY